MTGDDEYERAITFRCDDELKKRANVGSGRRGMSVSEYLRTLVREDTGDLPDHVIEGALLNENSSKAD